MIRNESPVVHIVAGPNGAGKTTFAMDYLLNEEKVLDFINADMIAKGISPLNPEAVQLEAGKIFLRLLDEKIAHRRSFAFETTLSGNQYLKKVKEWKASGWEIVLHFLWIPDAEFSKLRVQERVAQGGHNIPTDAIERRYARTLANLGRFCDVCDSVICYDNSTLGRAKIFSFIGKVLIVENASLYREIVKYFRA